MNEKEIILREIAVIDEALAIVCDRMNTDDRISDALLREVIECTENIKEAVDAWKNRGLSDMTLRPH